MLDSFLFPVPSVSYGESSFPGKLISVPDGKGGIPMLVLRPTRGQGKFVLFCCHANAADLGHMEAEGVQLAERLNCTVVIMEYPGYGICPGKPCLKSINAAAWTCFRTVVDKMKVDPQNIILFGRSIGTGVASKIAARAAGNNESVKGVVLVSPYTSILDVVSDHVSCVGVLFSHRWQPVIDLPKANAPILIIHGLRDELIRVEHSEDLLSKLKNHPKVPLNTFYAVPSTAPYPCPVYARIASEADHNQWHYDEDILSPITAFVNRVVPPGKGPLQPIDLKPFSIKKLQNEVAATCSSFRKHG
eukprot:TRINITY_DN1063_c0_g1_i1.p1 TRINITY_DN1063_c0_g1~~TRINITY_DN1063_c0_g1_i1.p1  ORF type:complete len:303 (+),score=22.56 TRINITY_DN1063_c0_g1_i1:39-947(+)